MGEILLVKDGCLLCINNSHQLFDTWKELRGKYPCIHYIAGFGVNTSTDVFGGLALETSQHAICLTDPCKTDRIDTLVTTGT